MPKAKKTKQQKKQKKWDKEKSLNNTFLIEQTFSDLKRYVDGCLWHDRDVKCDDCAGQKPDLYNHHAIWGNREGIVSLKTRRCEEFMPMPPGTSRKRGGQPDQATLDKFGIEWDDARGVYRNLPRKWRSDQYLVFSARQNPEKPRLLAMKFSKGGFRPSIYDLSYHMNSLQQKLGLAEDVPTDFVEEFARVCCLMRGVKWTPDFRLWHLTMPLLYNQVKYDGLQWPKALTSMPKELGRVFRHKSLTDAAAYVFGRATKGHRASMDYWIKNKKFGYMFAAMAAKGLVADDYLDALNLSTVFDTWDPQEKDVKRLRRLLKRVTETSRKKLMTDFNMRQVNSQSMSRYIRDIERSIEGIEGAGEDPGEILRRRMPRTWSEYHDALSDRYNQIQRDKEAAKLKTMKMAQSVGAQVLDKLTFDVADQGSLKKLEIIIPKDGTEVVMWGSEMSHCIGSYAKDMAAGRTLLFGLMAHYVEGGLNREALLATGEIRGGRLTQLYGKRNMSPEYGVREAVYTELARALPGLSVGGTTPTFYGPIQKAVETVAFDMQGINPPLAAGVDYADDRADWEEDVPF